MTDTTADQGHAIGRDKLLGHLAMVMFAGMIAGSFSLGKLTVPHIEPAPLNALRFILAAIIMAILAFGVQRHPFKLPAQPWRYAILSALMSFYFMTMFVSLGLTSAVATSAVYTLTPIVTAVIAYFLLRQKTGPLMSLSLAVAGVGSVWVIFRADLGELLAFNVGRGEVTYFVGCIGHAFFTVLLTRFNRGEPLAVSTFFIVLGNAAWLGVYGGADIVATDWMHLPSIVWVTVLYLAIFPSAISFMLVQFAARRLPASKVMAYGYLVPVFVIGIEGLAGHGWVTLAVAAGALVTCLGLVVLYFAPDQ